MNKKKIIREIVIEFNLGNKKEAVNKLKLARFLLKDKTYFYLMKKMKQPVLFNDLKILENKNSLKTLKQAQKILGGKIIEERA